MNKWDDGRISGYMPQRWPSVKSDVTTPLLQAVVTAVLLATLITFVLWALFGLNVVKTFGVTICLSLTIAWFWRLGVVTQTLWQVEEKLGVDITGDHVVGKPEPSVVRLEIVQGNRVQYVDIEGLDDLPMLRRFAILGLTNRFNERAVKNELGWTRERWQVVRDRLVERGLVEWNGQQEGSTQGVTLTDEGRETMEQVLKHST